MVGAVTESEVIIWARASGPFACHVEYDTKRNLTSPSSTDPILATKENNYAIKLKLAKLRPNTSYYYRIKVDGRADHYLRTDYLFIFKTTPSEEWKGEFSQAFGSCARVQKDSYHPI